jgi:hypothetical protein
MGGEEVRLHVFLFSVLEEREWLISRFRRFVPGEGC